MLCSPHTRRFLSIAHMWFILTPQVWTVNISVALRAEISWLSHVRHVRNVYDTQHMLPIRVSNSRGAGEPRTKKDRVYISGQWNKHEAWSTMSQKLFCSVRVQAKDKTTALKPLAVLMSQHIGGQRTHTPRHALSLFDVYPADMMFAVFRSQKETSSQNIKHRQVPSNKSLLSR